MQRELLQLVTPFCFHKMQFRGSSIQVGIQGGDILFRRSLFPLGGVWLMSHVTLSKRMKVWLEYIPGTVIVALVAPTVLTTGFAEAGAALVTLVVGARTRNVLLSMVVGVIVVWGLRTLLTILR
jgi:uncharacterized membrane protein